MLRTVALLLLSVASSLAADESCPTNSPESCLKASALLQKGFQTHSASLDNNQDTHLQHVQSAEHSPHLAQQPSLLMEKGLAASVVSLASSASTHHVNSLLSHQHKGSSAQAKDQKIVSSLGLGVLIEGSPAAAKNDAEVDPFKWGTDATHPKSIGKKAPHPSVQNYEAKLPYLTGMVLNIFVKESSGKGGLLLALEVPSACGSKDSWVEVARSRCSAQYPCALRLPGLAVRGSSDQPTRFRTKVISEDDDYGTDFMEYKRVTLDKEVEVVVAQGQFAKDKDGDKRALKFNLSPSMAAGALYVMPIVQNAGADTMITMKLRQPEPEKAALLEDFPKQQRTLLVGSPNQQDGSKQHAETLKLATSLQSYRKSWAKEWREPVGAVNACDFSLFEVVADQLYPGNVELEVMFNDNHTSGTDATISDVLITTRVSLAEAEVALLDTVLKDHFGYFNDPEVVIHGLPVGARKEGHPAEFVVSNPTEWGYAMQSWVVQAEMGVLKPDEAVAKLTETFKTLDTLQNDPNEFIEGMFYPLYRLRDSSGEKIFPTRDENSNEIPCGDDALLYTSMLMVQGWLKANKYDSEAKTSADILARVSFTGNCLHQTDCNEAINGQVDKNVDPNVKGDVFWSIPLTWNAKTKEKNTWNWNVWADEGGLVAMIIAMTGAVDHDQYTELVRQQMKYSPCLFWEGISVGHGAFFNSVFTLPTRSMLGFGTLFSSPYLHEFAVRSVLPTFRAHQKLKKKIGIDYMGPSDAMTQSLKGGRVLGSYAYWPPNSHYDCRLQKVIKENQCTWCDNLMAGGEQEPFDMVVPHGSMAAFLTAGMMETSQLTSWLEDTKRLMTDASGVYKRGYGLEVMAPAKRTPLGGTFEAAKAGRGIWESLSHGYTILGMYEGMATMRRRYELAAQERGGFDGFYEPPKYKPLSDFFDVLPDKRSIVDGLLEIANSQQSLEKQCQPSNFGAPGQY